MKKKYLVTPALPYANGPAHLGHLVEHIQVNIFVRALRMAKEDVLYVCGADSHGTPIEMNALKANVSPEKFAQGFQIAFESVFKGFGISFDGGFGTTHTKTNEEHAAKIYYALKDKGLIKKRSIEQLYDPKLKRFLPDRMVRGTCPKCKANDQYGDSCEACSSTYQPTDLINPKSALSKETPIIKESEHYFVSLSKFETKLKEWMNNDTISEDISSYLKHWLKEGLKDWDISRDGPYFGFKIPGEENKYFYVWLDAPIGYISLSDKAAKEIGRSYEDYWQEKNTLIYHFIGKDIVYFHTLFWPAMLMAADYTLPHKVVVHGMLTVNGEKMSKSRGTFILADTYLRYLNPEALRYYYACKLTDRPYDIDLSFDDFTNRVNTDLVNKVVNLISRSLPLLHRANDGEAEDLDDTAKELIGKTSDLLQSVKKYYIECDYAKAMNEIIRFAELGNKYLQDNAPWNLLKDNKKKAAQILTTGLYLGKVCFALLKPVLPNAVRVLEETINDGKEFDFDNILDSFPIGQKFKPYKHLFNRVDPKKVKAMQEESKEKPKKEHKAQEEESTNLIDIKSFMDVELRAAKVLEASEVKEADKLIKLSLDVGEHGKRQVFAGLRPHVTPEDLKGKTVVVVANLKPRKMRFGLSEGMILACGEDKPEPLILETAKPGERVR